jgi:hypothetical protein
MRKNVLFRLLTIPLFCLALFACRPYFSAGAYYPAIAYDPINGRYLAVYLKVQTKSPDAGGSGNSRLYGVFVDSSGSLHGNEFVISGDSGFYYCPTIVFDSTHMKYLVIWNAENSIYGQFINSDGSLSGTRLTLSSTASAPYGRCSAASYDDIAQKFIAAWGEVNSANHDSIYAQLLNADGSFAGPKLTVSNDGALPTHPSIAYDELSQRFLVVWNSAYYVSIKGRVINPDGTFIATEFPISSPSGSYYVPAVTYDSVDARFLVSWEYTVDGCTYGLQGQLLNADGSAYQSLIGISSPGRNVYHHASVYNPSDDNYLIIFDDFAQDKELLYAQVVKSDGTLDTTVSNNNILISNDAYPFDARPAAAFDSINKRYFPIWEYGVTDYGQAFPDIHGRLVNTNGSPATAISVVSNGGEW